MVRSVDFNRFLASRITVDLPLSGGASSGGFDGLGEVFRGDAQPVGIIGHVAVGGKRQGDLVDERFEDTVLTGFTRGELGHMPLKNIQDIEHHGPHDVDHHFAAQGVVLVAGLFLQHVVVFDDAALFLFGKQGAGAFFGEIIGRQVVFHHRDDLLGETVGNPDEQPRQVAPPFHVLDDVARLQDGDVARRSGVAAGIDGKVHFTVHTQGKTEYFHTGGMVEQGQ